MFKQSVILYGKSNYDQQLTQWIGGNWTAKLCWRATRDGWTHTEFHSGCDDKAPTVAIVKVGDYVFGGFATATWSGKINILAISEWLQPLISIQLDCSPTAKMKPENHEFGVPRWPPQDFRLIEIMATSVGNICWPNPQSTLDLEYQDGTGWLQNFDGWSYGKSNPVVY